MAEDNGSPVLEDDMLLGAEGNIGHCEFVELIILQWRWLCWWFLLKAVVLNSDFLLKKNSIQIYLFYPIIIVHTKLL